MKTTKLRRRVLTLVCTAVMVCTLLVLAGCGGSSNDGKETSDEVITLSFSHVDPESRFSHVAIEYFRDQLEEISGGKMTVEIFPNSALGDEIANFEGMQSGSIDMSFMTNGPASQFVPSIRIFDFPFLFDSTEHAQAVIHGDIPEQFADDFEEVGVHWLACWENGFRSLGNNRNPIVEPEDAEGIKIRTLQTDTMVAGFEALGVQAIPMAASETYTATQNGVIDGFDQTAAGLISFKQYEVIDYWTVTEMYYPVAWVCISQQRWDSLTDEQKGWVEEAMARATEKESELCVEASEAAPDQAEEFGVEVVRADEFNREAFVEKTKVVYEKYKDWYDEDVLKQIKEVGKSLK